ncbi:MAG: long-chain fatty acid--CoA ligase, partial [Halioglobus sp.]|nr:long-chain fatty acid--CoA ligase [Halioglobus sp.]
LRLIEQEQVTTWASLGNMATRVLDHPDFDNYNVSSVTRIGSGGAPTSEQQQKRMTAGFTGTGGSMALGYGLTESAGVGTHNWGDLLTAQPHSVGRVFPAIEITIRDDDNNEIPGGAEGEICIRGTCVMLEYWKKPRATAETMVAGRWLKTGDIGRFDGEFLTINTRARDLILRNAENIYPVEVEHCLQLHPSILDAAVYGLPHAEWGQEIGATIVVPHRFKLNEAELIEFCSARLATFKVPTRWIIQAEPLPRNAAQKVLKKVLATSHTEAIAQK